MRNYNNDNYRRYADENRFYIENVDVDIEIIGIRIEHLSNVIICGAITMLSYGIFYGVLVMINGVILMNKLNKEAKIGNNVLYNNRVLFFIRKYIPEIIIIYLIPSISGLSYYRKHYSCS